jgi:hypothetical protein
VSAGDVITAQTLNVSGLGGAIYLLGPGRIVFYSSDLCNSSASTTNQVTTAGLCTVEFNPDDSTGTATLKVALGSAPG